MQKGAHCEWHIYWAMHSSGCKYAVVHINFLQYPAYAHRLKLFSKTPAKNVAISYTAKACALPFQENTKFLDLVFLLFNTICSPRTITERSESRPASIQNYQKSHN
jgi:hypothetical protein